MVLQKSFATEDELQQFLEANQRFDSAVRISTLTFMNAVTAFWVKALTDDFLFKVG
jgi:hypothetical protein